MLIAISQKNDQNKHGNFIDSLENSYINYLEKLGIKLLIIPNSTESVNYYFNRFPIEGMILSGGNDVDPELYGGVRGKNSSLTIARDNTEKKMLEIAVEKKMSLLGICRGMQIINVFFGGKLIDLNENEEIHPVKEHLIEIINSKAEEILGKNSIINSYHNFGITKELLSPKLKAFAICSDQKVIEGIYHPDLPIVGIQWHPERFSPDSEFNEKLVRMFMEKKLFWKK